MSGKNAFLICAFRSADFLRWCLSPERNLTHNLFFYFQSFFGINLIHFFGEKKDSAAGNLIVCLLRSPVTPFDRSKTKTPKCSGRAQRFRQRKVCTQRPSRGETLRCKFLARKGAKLFANTKVHIFGKEMCKIHRQLQRYYKVTSLPSLSLSLSPSAPHAQYRKRFRASYNT